MRDRTSQATAGRRFKRQRNKKVLHNLSNVGTRAGHIIIAAAPESLRIHMSGLLVPHGCRPGEPWREDVLPSKIGAAFATEMIRAGFKATAIHVVAFHDVDTDRIFIGAGVCDCATAAVEEMRRDADLVVEEMCRVDSASLIEDAEGGHSSTVHFICPQCGLDAVEGWKPFCSQWCTSKHWNHLRAGRDPR